MLNPGGTDLDAESQLFNKLLLDAAATEAKSSDDPTMGGIAYTQIIPKPGFCVKLKSSSGAKIFVNVCHAENVPAPRDMTEDELLKLLDSEDPFGFRIPMSLGQPHAEVDKSGQGCTVYDVVVNPSFLEKMKNSDIFKSFFLTITIEGIEDKYSQTLSREWIILKNRKFVGKLSEHNIRKESKPLIMEVDSPGETQVTEPQKKDIVTRYDIPEYRIIQDPPKGHPEFLVAEIQLPKVKTVNSLTLDIGEDRLLLQTRSNVYQLDVYLPYLLVQEDCGAQFNRKTRILTVTMCVQPLS